MSKIIIIEDTETIREEQRFGRQRESKNDNV